MQAGTLIEALHLTYYNALPSVELRELMQNAPPMRCASSLPSITRQTPLIGLCGNMPYKQMTTPTCKKP